MTNPSRSASYARDATAGVSLYLLESAPIASNKMDIVQCVSSPPPAKTISCWPWRIKSYALPIQCKLVEHAELIE